MGADEKHAATYHGAEYTPDTEIMRCLFKIGRVTRNQNVGGQQMDAEFDRWLETVRAEAKAEAYKDAERILHEEARWQLDLHQRHKEYRFKHCSERMTEMENCMTVRASQYKENQ
ncbi:hypothetical protein [Glutamicibacter sp. ZJUTW]|uniref:hypothetical protein n=1 Tax=Glutamicibacter sp. ZJUTW TaxID=1155384 RepID=UPI0011F2242F|nr:hypothetical protein [Glutamicibacter sp. ZJUTW]QEP06158.1 hypothetical protein F0M17_02240 [Glutamicibacter sp. ZJUTW]